MAWKLLMGKKTYINTTIAGTGTINNMDQKRFDDNMIARPNWLFTDNSSKIIVSSFLNHKISKIIHFQNRVHLHTLFYNLDLNSTINNDPATFPNYVKENGVAIICEYYVQSKYDITART